MSWIDTEDPVGVYLYSFPLSRGNEIIIKRSCTLDTITYCVVLFNYNTLKETVCLHTPFTSFNDALHGANRYLATQGIIACS